MVELKNLIIWVILRHGNGSSMKLHLTPIIPGGFCKQLNF